MITIQKYNMPNQQYSKYSNALHFKGVFAKLKDKSLEINNNNNNFDYYDKFIANAEDIDKEYESSKAKIENSYIFQSRRLRRLDDKYEGQKDALKRDRDSFLKAKEAHLKDIELMIKKNEEYGHKLEENNNLKKDRATMLSIIDNIKQQQANNANIGFNKIAGYESEKATLQNILINPIFEEKAGILTEIPNAILFFGPTGTGKTTFAKALGQEIQNGKNPQIIDMSNPTINEIMNEINLITEKAKEHFKETQERTLILLDEVEYIGNSDSEILEELKAKISIASNEDKCIYIMTSNYPNLIATELLTPSRVAFLVDVDPPSIENTKAVCQHYFKNIQNGSFDYDILANEFFKDKNGDKFSNSGIENVYTEACKYKLKTTQEILELIKKTKPNITQNDLELYKLNKEKLLGGKQK